MRRYSHHILPCILLILFPLIVTYPLLLNLHRGMFMPGDNFITMWTSAWQVHALFSEDHFWNANIFHPYPRTLSLSVLRAIYIPFAAAILEIDRNPVLMENLILLLSLGASGIGMYAFCFHRTGNVYAALLGALVFICAPERFSRIPHPHLVNPIFFGPSLLFLSMFLRSNKKLHLFSFSLCLFLQYLTSIYLFIFTCIAIPLLMMSDMKYLFDQWRDKLLSLLITFSITLVLLIPFMIPYIQNRMQYSAGVDLEWIGMLSARPGDYLSAWHYNLLWGWTEGYFSVERSMEFVPPEFLFIGLVPWAFFLLCMYLLYSKNGGLFSETWYFSLLMIAVGFVLSLGPELHLGDSSTGIPLPALLLYQFIPGFSVARVPARFSMLVTAGAGISVAVGCAYILTGINSRKKYAILAVIYFLAILEMLNHPLPITAIPVGVEIPKVEQWLHDREEQVIVTYPLRYGLAYMYFSTWHWKKLINGWSGYIPPGIREDEEKLQNLPAAEALDVLSRRGAQLIVIYRNLDTEPELIMLSEQEREESLNRIEKMNGMKDHFEILYDDGQAMVYKFTRGSSIH